ncbi:hypothetical protein CBR_g83567, partial [Chara braunii]
LQNLLPLVHMTKATRKDPPRSQRPHLYSAGPAQSSQKLAALLAHKLISACTAAWNTTSIPCMSIVGRTLMRHKQIQASLAN